MRKDRRWSGAVLVGLAWWYLIAGCGIWLGLDPSTILFRATVASLGMATLCAIFWSWLSPR